MSNNPYKETIISADYFWSHYQPIKNHLDDNSSFDGFMFETYKQELEYVTAQNEENIWTILEADNGNLFIASGLHWVNRLGYLISKIPRKDNSYIEILLE